MAIALARIILVGEMDVIAYTEQHSILCCFPGWRRAIEALGIGWRLLSPHSILMTARPSAPPNFTQDVFSAASPRRVAYGVRAFCRRNIAVRGGQNG